MNEYFEEKLWAEADSEFQKLSETLKANMKKLECIRGMEE